MKYLAHMKATLPCSWLAEAVTCNKENVEKLIRAQKGIGKRYEAFDQIIVDHLVSPKKKGRKAMGPVLVNFYSKPPAVLDRHLTTRRRDHGLVECPYCGHPFVPDTLDHFLPKDDWPEFAIMANNLVPQCQDCAPIKGTRYYSVAHGSALYLHPIYTDILSKISFKIHAKLVNDLPDFEPRFEVADGVSADDRKRISLHLKELKVPARMVQYCHRQYTQWELKLKEKANSIQLLLTQRVSELPYANLAANWEGAFLQGVLASPEVMAELQKSSGVAEASEPAPVYVPLEV